MYMHTLLVIGVVARVTVQEDRCDYFVIKSINRQIQIFNGFLTT